MSELSFRRTWLLAILGLAVCSAAFVVLQEWWTAVLALAGLAIAALVRAWWAPATAGVVTALLGAWPVAALLALASVSKFAIIRIRVRDSDRADPLLLAGAVDRIDPRLGVRPAGAALDTADLLRAAMRDGRRKDIWGQFSDQPGADHASNLDPAPTSGEATLYAGEACMLAERAADRLDLELDIDLYAASAVLVYDSAVYGACGGDLSIFEQVTGAHEDQVGQVLAEFVADYGGGDLMRRMSRRYRRRWLGPFQ
ncbi:MAG: hypothetical protein GY788_07660 [bacterium]|nr:hypothetical protein [bacterium]